MCKLFYHLCTVFLVYLTGYKRNGINIFKNTYIFSLADVGKES